MDKLYGYIKEYSFFQIILVCVVGILTPLLMIGYDWSLIKLTGAQISKRKLIEISYLINSYCNVMNFGGFVNVGLRFYFYGRDKKDSKEFSKTLAKIVPYQFFGVALFGFISFLILVFTNQGIYVEKYKVLLGFVTLFIPVFYILSRNSKFAILGNLPRNFKFEQILVSIFECCGILASFIAIGYILGIEFDIVYVVILVTVAGAIGII